MSASPVIRIAFAVSVAWLSAAPIFARDNGNNGETPLVWSPVPASPPAWEAGPAAVPLAPQVASGPCFATPNDGTTVFTGTAQAVRDALAAAVANGTVKMAGYCAGVAAQGGATQVVRITQPLTLAGGYTTTDWMTYNPAGNPTTLDAQVGGRVISVSVAATLRGFTVTGGYISSAVSQKGAGVNAAGALTLSDMIVSGNTITGVASNSGGGAYAGGAASVSDTIFRNNKANGSGGGIFAASVLALTGTQFISNTTSNVSSIGGGAYAQGAATINGGLFQRNTAGGYAGGLLAASTLALSGTQFISNTTASATGEGGGAQASGTATLDGGLFQGNSAGYGGGLLAFSALALSGTQFVGNRAGANGGGLLAFSTLALSGTQFVGNRAGANGGGLLVSSESAHRIVNALFAGNSAATNGAAIHVDAAAPLSLIHATIVSQTAPTGAKQAIYVVGGAVYLTNTLIATHTIGIARAGGAVRDWNTLFAGVATPYSGTVTSAGGITGTAGFVNPAAGDYHLGAGSAAINAGVDAGVYTDFEGQPRPQGGGFDIGYDESPFAPRAYLPVVAR